MVTKDVEYLWIALAVYGIFIQTVNTRWMLFMRKTVYSEPLPNFQRLTVAIAHIRVNVLRNFVVWFNLFIGVLLVIEPDRPLFILKLIAQYTTPLEGFTTIVFVAGFLFNEFCWDIIITLEVLGRRKLRKQGPPNE